MVRNRSSDQDADRGLPFPERKINADPGTNCGGAIMSMGRRHELPATGIENENDQVS